MRLLQVKVAPPCLKKKLQNYNRKYIISKFYVYNSEAITLILIGNELHYTMPY